MSSSSSSSSSSTLAELVQKWLWKSASYQDLQHQELPSAFQLHEGVTLNLLNIESVEPGRVVCSFRVPSYLTDSSGSLQAGVIASIVDNVGASALVTLEGNIRLSVDLNISFMSPASIDDELEIEATVLKLDKPIGFLTVDIRNRTTDKLVAQGRHSMFYLSSKL